MIWQRSRPPHPRPGPARARVRPRRPATLPRVPRSLAGPYSGAWTRSAAHRRAVSGDRRVEHSLRWDVLPVRIRGGKQHAKLSLLAWTSRVRVIVALANLTEPGYRTNHEVAEMVDLTPTATQDTVSDEALAFFESLLRFVPSAAEELPAVTRARAFLASRAGLRCHPCGAARGHARIPAGLALLDAAANGWVRGNRPRTARSPAVSRASPVAGDPHYSPEQPIPTDQPSGTVVRSMASCIRHTSGRSEVSSSTTDAMCIMR